jgi:hypothetical protein
VAAAVYQVAVVVVVAPALQGVAEMEGFLEAQEVEKVIMGITITPMTVVLVALATALAVQCALSGPETPAFSHQQILELYNDNAYSA